MNATPEAIQRFADLVLEQRRERFRREYPESRTIVENETVNVHAGSKYTRVDVGPYFNISGKYMVENSTGVIYGIKGYGRVHRGHQYGTLDTIDRFDWSGYTAVEVNE